MGYKVQATAFVNRDLEAARNEFSKRRIVLKVPIETIRYFDIDAEFMTKEYVEQLESVLRLQGDIVNTSIVKAVEHDMRTATIKLYIIDPNFQLVEDGRLPMEIDY